MFATSWILMTRRADFFNLPPKHKLAALPKSSLVGPEHCWRKWQPGVAHTHLSRVDKLHFSSAAGSCQRHHSGDSAGATQGLHKDGFLWKQHDILLFCCSITRSRGFHSIHTNRKCTFSDRFSWPETEIILGTCHSSKPLLILHSNTL